MRRRLTLQRRVTLWSVLVLALTALLCGGGAAVYLYCKTLQGIDAHALGMARRFFQLLAAHGGEGFNWADRHEVEEWLPRAHDPELVEVHRNGSVYFRSPVLGAEELPAGAPQFLDLRPGRMRAVSLSEGGTDFRIAVPIDRLTDLKQALLVIGAVGLPLMLLVIVAGGRWIAHQGLEPVRRIADEAERITSEQLKRRVPVPEAADDIQRLALVLNETLDRLERSFQQAMRFSADASHELKTPLTLLHSELEALLAAPTLTEPDRVAVADALETAKRLNAITRSLLLLAQADAGRLAVELEPIDLVPLVADCLQDAEILAETAELILESDLPPSAPICGEAIRLQQIVSNLLDNAVKYNRPGGRIRVTLGLNQETWRMEVSNTGQGIPPEQAGRIFERFFRVAHHAAISGHGLGLSLAHELARAHGGTLTLAGSTDGWTTFRLELPAAISAMSNSSLG